MNKESIYQIIGYQGEYSESVKKALKKLLKENHPDHGGDYRIFELITSVKKELETDHVSYVIKPVNKVKKYDDIDYDYCNVMINKLTKEETKLKEIIKKNKNQLDNLNNEYKKVYSKSIEKETLLINNSQDLNKLNTLKTRLIILIILLIITFLIAVIKNKILVFAIFGVLSIITIIEIYSFYQMFNKLNNKHEQKLHKYVGVVSKMRDIIHSKEEIEKELLEKERSLNIIQNDLRFYHHLIDK